MTAEINLTYSWLKKVAVKSFLVLIGEHINFCIRDGQWLAHNTAQHGVV